MYGMTTQELVDFIRRQNDIGVSKETVTKILTKHGWDVADVEEGYRAINQEVEAIDVPAKPAVTSNTQTPLMSFGGQPSNSQPAQMGADGRDALAAEIDSVLNTKTQETPHMEDQSVADVSVPQLDQEVSTPVPSEVTAPQPVPGTISPAPQAVAPSSVQSKPQAASYDTTPPWMQQAPVVTAPEPQPTVASPETQTITEPVAAPVQEPPILDPYRENPLETKEEVSPAPQAVETKPPVAQPSFQPEKLGMQTIAEGVAGATPKPKKKRGALFVILAVVLLLLVGAGLQLFGVISIPGLPSLSKDPSTLWRSALASVEQAGAFEYRAFLQINNTNDPAERLVVNVDAKHEFFAPENQIGVYIFDVTSGSESFAGELRFQNQNVQFRPTQASEGVMLANLQLSEYVGDWFVFSAESLKQNGHLLFDVQSLGGMQRQADTAEILSNLLISLAELQVAPYDGVSEGEDEMFMVAPAETAVPQTVDSFASVVEPYLQGVMDQPNIVAVLSTLTPEFMTISVSGNELKTAVLPFSADNGGYEGQLELQVVNIDQPVDITPNARQSLALSEYIAMRSDGEVMDGFSIDGDRLLVDLLQNARVYVALDFLAEAQRLGQIYGSENGSYSGICAEQGINMTLADFATTFPDAQADCRTNGVDFVLLSPFDTGFVCADSTQFISAIDTAPQGFTCTAAAEESVLE